MLRNTYRKLEEIFKTLRILVSVIVAMRDRVPKMLCSNLVSLKTTTVT